MKKIKSALAIILMLSLSINTFGAQVSDNDGSAFITKAEFDSLKSTFQSQIDQYNQSIDNKIDGAIASYLSGIVIETSVHCKSLINVADAYFAKDFAFNPTETKTSYQGMWYIGESEMCAGYANRPENHTTEWKISNNSGSAGTWKYYNYDSDPQYNAISTPDKSKYYEITEKRVKGVNYWAINRYFESLPRVAILIATWNFGNRMNGIDNTAYYDIPATTWSFDGADPSFTNKDISLNFKFMKTSTTQGFSVNANGFYFSRPGDDFIGWDFANDMASGHYDNENLQCVQDVEMEKAKKYGDPVCFSNIGWTWSEYKDSSTVAGLNAVGARVMTSSTHTQQPPDADRSKLKVQVYSHKYTSDSTYTTTNLINGKVSVALDQPIYYYNGLPLFKATMDGTANIDLRFNNVAGGTTLFSISNDKFDNSDITGSSINVDNVEISTGDYTVPNNTDITIKFDAKKGETYWIKASPSEAKSKIVTTKTDIVAS